MGVLQRIGLGPGSQRIVNKTEEPPRAFQGQKIASLANSPSPPPPPPRSSSSRAVTKEHVQPSSLPEVGQLKPRRHPEPKFPPVAPKLDSNSNSSSTPNTSNIMSDLTAITRVYGPDVNIYTDVLSVSPTASAQEIREAFFCLRYGIYQQLSEEGDHNGPLSQEERKKVEMKMDAVSTAFQILSDRNRRAMYDQTLAQKTGGRGGALPASTRDSPTKQRNAKQAESPVSIAQKRSAYRRQMNAQQRRPIQGAMNERKPAAPVFLGETVEKEEDKVPTFNMKGTSVKHVDTSKEVIDQYQDQEAEESPTAVDEFDSMNKFKNVKLDDSPARNRQESESPEPDDRTYEEDDRTYDDDSRTYGTYGTYDDESYYTYGDTTLGTYDDSTYVTYDDDEQTYETYDDDRGKYSPSHKTRDMPEPILKGSTPKGKKDKKKTSRRVTIHSHRGKGESGEDGWSGLDDAFEELSGTYKDFKQTLNQVGSAFILSPDDIDKMSDKIRDAQMELVETYEKQVGKQVGKQQQQQQKGKKGVKLSKPSKKAIKN